MTAAVDTSTLRSRAGRIASPAMLGSIATGVAGQVVLVASGIVVARTLGPENRGFLALMVLVTLIVSQIGNLGVPLSVTYWISSKGVKPSLLIHSLRRFRGVQLLLLGLVQAGLTAWLVAPRVPSDFRWIAFASIAATAALVSQTYGLGVLQGLERFLPFNILRLLGGALYAAAVVVLWVVDDATLSSIALSFIVTNVIAWAVVHVVLTRTVPHSEEGEPIATRPLVSFGLRALIGSSPPVEALRLDQLLIGLLLQPVALGYYVVAVSFTSLTRFVGQSIGMVTYPSVAAAADGRARLRVIRRDFALGTAVCGATTAILVLLMPWLLPAAFGSAFRPSVSVAQLLLVASLLASVRRILIDGTRGLGHPTWGTCAELLTLVTLPILLVVTQYSTSLMVVAGVLTLANAISLAVVVPVLFGAGA